MPGPTTGDNYLIQAAHGSTSEAPARGNHRRDSLPREGEEIEAEGGVRRKGAVQGEGTGVEVGATEEVDVGPEGDRSEVAEAVGGGIAREGREWTPRAISRVEEEGRGNGRIFREYAEEV